MNDFKNIKAIIFDLDGTLYSGSHAIPHAVETVSYLKQKGYEIFYLTNNSTRTPAQIKTKLDSLGFNAGVERICSSLSASITYLKHQNIQSVYCVGMKELIIQLQANGITVVNDTDALASAQAVLVGMDSDLSYKKIADAYRIFQLNDKCKLIACNLDRSYPVENGVRLPGCGAGVAAIENACEKKMDYIVGKPNAYMLELLSDEWNLNKDELMLVGDTLDSDIAMANSFGCKGVLISDKKHADSVLTIPSIEILQKWL